MTATGDSLCVYFIILAPIRRIFHRRPKTTNPGPLWDVQQHCTLRSSLPPLPSGAGVLVFLETGPARALQLRVRIPTSLAQYYVDVVQVARLLASQKGDTASKGREGGGSGGMGGGAGSVLRPLSVISKPQPLSRQDCRCSFPTVAIINSCEQSSTRPMPAHFTLAPVSSRHAVRMTLYGARVRWYRVKDGTLAPPRAKLLQVRPVTRLRHSQIIVS